MERLPKIILCVVLKTCDYIEFPEMISFKNPSLEVQMKVFFLALT